MTQRKWSSLLLHSEKPTDAFKGRREKKAGKGYVENVL